MTLGFQMPVTIHSRALNVKGQQVGGVTRSGVWRLDSKFQNWHNQSQTEVGKILKTIIIISHNNKIALRVYNASLAHCNSVRNLLSFRRDIRPRRVYILDGDTCALIRGGEGTRMGRGLLTITGSFMIVGKR